MIGMGRNWENKWPREGATGGRAVVGMGGGVEEKLPGLMEAEAAIYMHTYIHRLVAIGGGLSRTRAQHSTHSCRQGLTVKKK